MNKTKVRIIILPSGTDISEIQGYDESIYGTAFSNLREIQVNQVAGGYSVLYKDNIFGALKPIAFANNIIELFNNSFPNTLIKIEMYYLYTSRFNYESGLNIVRIDDFLNDCDNPLIEYQVTPVVEYLANHYDEDMEDFDFDPDLDEDDEDEDDDDDEDGDNDDYLAWLDEDGDENPFPFFNHDDYDDDDYPKKKKRKRASYDHSKVWSSSSKVKRNIKRHGIIVSSNKEARKKDEKTIKAFLKDFIPGNSKWAKAYRAEMLKRWMTMYVISKKAAKRLAKDHKEQSRKSNGKSILNRDDAVKITKRLFETAIDPFYDPTR